MAVLKRFSTWIFVFAALAIIVAITTWPRRPMIYPPGQFRVPGQISPMPGARPFPTQSGGWTADDYEKVLKASTPIVLAIIGLITLIIERKKQKVAEDAKKEEEEKRMRTAYYNDWDRPPRRVR